MVTELLSDQERAAALQAITWRESVLRLNGQSFGTLDNQSIDLIDTAIGPNQVRAALVALYEAADLLVEGSRPTLHASTTWSNAPP
jgi:phosphopantetheinyl transferase